MAQSHGIWTCMSHINWETYLSKPPHTTSEMKRNHSEKQHLNFWVYMKLRCLPHPKGKHKTEQVKFVYFKIWNFCLGFSFSLIRGSMWFFYQDNKFHCLGPSETQQVEKLFFNISIFLSGDRNNWKWMMQWGEKVFNNDMIRSKSFNDPVPEYFNFSTVFHFCFLFP
jgi:hypothetical protein